MPEHVDKRILFDFEVITLIALFVGLGVFAVFGSFRREPRPGIGAKFSALDLILVAFPLSVFLINPILTYVAAIHFPPPEKSPAPSDFSQFMSGLQNLVFFFIIGVITIAILKYIMMHDVSEVLGLRRMSWPSIVIFGLAGTLLSYALSSWLAGSMSTQFLTDKLGDLDAQKSVEAMKEAKSLPFILVSILVACIAAPIVEETLFRGYFYGALKRFTSPLFAALISSALFAVVHLNLPALFPLWIFAILLTLFYELTRCLWVPILIHALFNGFNVFMLLFDKTGQGS